MMLNLVEMQYIKMKHFSLSKSGNRKETVSGMLKDMILPFSQHHGGCVFTGDYNTMDVLIQEVNC